MVGGMWERMSRQKRRLPSQTRALDVEVRVEPLSLVLDPNLRSHDPEPLEYLLELVRLKEFDLFDFSQESSLLVSGQFSTRPYVETAPVASHEVKFVHDSSVITTSIGQVDEIFRLVSPWEAKHEIVAATTRDSLIAYLATNSLGFHLFVTESDFLLAHPHLGETFAVTPISALAFAGLTMRMRGESVLWTTEHGTGTAENIWAYFIESRYLFEPIAQYAIGDGSQSRYSRLLGGAVQRGQQLLRIRDELVIYQMCPPGTYLTDPVFSFETFWLYSSGIFDCISMALNEGFQMGFSPSLAKFGNSKFRAALAKKVESVSGFAVRSGTYDLIDIISKLRNTIHAEPSSRSSVHNQESEYFVMVPSDVSGQIKKHAGQFNLASAIGVEDTDGRLHLKSVAFIECVLPLLIERANGLVMSASWPRSALPPPAFSTSPEHMNFIGSAKRNHLLFGLYEGNESTLAAD